MIDNLTEAISHAREVAEEIHKTNEEMPTDCKLSEDLCKCASEHEQIAAWLTELQERREADKWRPISEPPKEHDYYLVTCEFGVASATDIALFYPDRKREEQWSLNYVTAWKPLPEPYESEA